VGLFLRHCKERTFMGKMLAVVFGLGLLTACGGNPSGGESEAEEGSSLQLNLSTVGASGTEYRLGPASFDIYRYQALIQTVVADGSARTAHVPLEPHYDYEVRLQPSWTLSRVEGTTLTPVAATLTSEDRQFVAVKPFVTTPVSFAFHLGEAGIDLGVTVDEGIPPGYDGRLVAVSPGPYQVEWNNGGTYCCVTDLAQAQALFPGMLIYAPTP
jgi:hypothetical protein